MERSYASDCRLLTPERCQAESHRSGANTGSEALAASPSEHPPLLLLSQSMSPASVAMRDPLRPPLRQPGRNAVASASNSLSLAGRHCDRQVDLEVAEVGGGQAGTGYQAGSGSNGGKQEARDGGAPAPDRWNWTCGISNVVVRCSALIKVIKLSCAGKFSEI